MDEDTAALIEKDGIPEAVGTGKVTIIDSRNAVCAYFDRKPGEVLTVFDTALDVLGPGRKFNLHSRRPILLGETDYVGGGETVKAARHD